MNYRPVDMHQHKSDVLVVHCSDPRFQPAHRSLIDGLGKHYDLLVFPGASKFIVENQNVLESIKLLHSLHRFEEIHIYDHIECGAFGTVENENDIHKKMIAKAKKQIAKALPNVKIYGHLVGESQKIVI